jgi:hypothetical protein
LTDANERDMGKRRRERFSSRIRDPGMQGERNMAQTLTKAQLRKKYGQTGMPIFGDRVLCKRMSHDFGTPAHSLLVIDTKAGTYTSVNVYGEPSDCHTGRGYDPEGMTHPLPPTGDEKWKKWTKDGYEDVPVDRFDIVAFAAEEQPTEQPTEQPVA